MAAPPVLLTQSMLFLDEPGALPEQDREAALNTLAAELNERGRRLLMNRPIPLAGCPGPPPSRGGRPGRHFRLVTPPAPEIAQAAMDEIMTSYTASMNYRGPCPAADATTRTLRRAMDPAGLTTLPPAMAGAVPKTLAACPLPDSGEFGESLNLRFCPDSDLMLLTRTEDEIWFQAVSATWKPLSRRHLHLHALIGATRQNTPDQQAISSSLVKAATIS